MNRIEGEKLFERLLKKVEGQSNEVEEYYRLLNELQYYDICMRDEFKEALYKEAQAAIDFEDEWSESEFD
jgi:hypothetical protein